jgi:hypothetical protein
MKWLRLEFLLAKVAAKHGESHRDNLRAQACL